MDRLLRDILLSTRGVAVARSRRMDWEDRRIKRMGWGRDWGLRMTVQRASLHLCCYD